MRMELNKKEVQLIEGQYAPFEAKSIISQLIKKQINHYKLQFMIAWESNHQTMRDEYDKKINSLLALENELDQMCKKAKENGCCLDIFGTFNISLKKN